MDKVQCTICKWVGLVPKNSVGECLNPDCNKWGYIGTLEFDITPANRINPLLNYLSELGLTIDGDNRNFVIGSEAVEEVTNKWDGNREYVVGTVPADNESLANVEYDICFGVVERYHDRISSGTYKFLHKLAENNNATQFIEYLRTVNDKHDTHANMADEVEDMLVAVESELQSFVREIRDAGGNINEQ